MSRRRRSSNRPWAVVGIVALLALGAGAGWFWLQSGEDADPVPADPPTAADPDPTFPDPVSPPPEDLPELEASDEYVRGLAERLSTHPRIAGWLVTDALIQRFVVAVVNLAGGVSPAEHLDFMAPEEDFRVRESAGRLVVDPEGYRRYDVLAEAVASLDTEGTVELYQRLEPLIREAYQDLGISDTPFDEMLERAVGNLLAVPIPDEPPEVEPGEEGVVYIFSDPALEGRTDAQKHLLRMGPDNARRVQAKVEELAQEIGARP